MHAMKAYKKDAYLILNFKAYTRFTPLYDINFKQKQRCKALSIKLQVVLNVYGEI